MKYLTLLLFTWLVIAPNKVSAEEKRIPVTLPINGKLAFLGLQTNPKNDLLFTVETYTGVTELKTQDVVISNPVWTNSGQKIAYTSAGNSVNYINVNDSQRIRMNNLSFPHSWSPDESQLIFSDIKTDPLTRSLGILDVNKESTSFLFEYIDRKPFASIPLPPLPDGIDELMFDSIQTVQWNPVYEEWIALSLTGMSEEIQDITTGYPLSIYINFLYNLKTGQMLSIDSLYSFSNISNGVFFVAWYPDGKSFLVDLNDLQNTYVILNLEENAGKWQVREVQRFASNGERINEWLGVEDLLLTSKRDDTSKEIIYSVAQLVDGQWFSQEFFRLSVQGFRITKGQDWVLTADEAERKSLSCLFDQTLTARLEVGSEGRVTFTDGTLTRLHAEPGTDTEVVTQMREGTSFEVIDIPSCADGYRWWHIQLEDGTTGYAAEADTEAYFLEPLQ